MGRLEAAGLAAVLAVTGCRKPADPAVDQQKVLDVRAQATAACYTAVPQAEQSDPLAFQRCGDYLKPGDEIDFATAKTRFATLFPNERLKSAYVHGDHGAEVYNHLRGKKVPKQEDVRSIVKIDFGEKGSKSVYVVIGTNGAILMEQVNEF